MNRELKARGEARLFEHRVELVPVLEAIRELYTRPIGMERFNEYVRMATSGGELTLPISHINPMAKPHALAYVENLLALHAERVALDAAATAAAELPPDSIRTCIILLDDLMGGWTNRTFAEFAHRYERKYEIAHRWATIVLWTSEKPTTALIRERTRETMHRTICERRGGPVQSLREIMNREGETMRFAGRTTPRYDADTLARARAVIDPHLDSKAAPIVIAALYGDDAAKAVGYPPLGLPHCAGYELSLADRA
ncbi:MAG: hypothetical protein M3N13_06160 [Candidatus Eremiobacteraeota bacterium]|nr:hypothetical protein [Candidatus Eremiobacteraeota bacterium]